MPKIGGYHLFCHKCSDENVEPKYKWCPHCRAQERQRKRRRYSGEGVQKQKSNPCGLTYVGIVNAASPTDALVDGLQCIPGHASGWWEIC